jgi:polysaccharide chain length determinant protein (PEP-CTERM system associated)
MMEDFEEKNPEGLDLDKYLGIARRRHWQFLIPLFFGWALVFGASWFLASTYKSATTILIEQPTVSKELVPSNVNDNLQGRLQSITQQILSRTRLLHIIDTLDLYADLKSRTAPDDLVERMRKDIGIELVRSGNDQLTSFNVSFSARDPRVAQQVTSELTNLFISENLEVQTTESQDTTKFFETQLDEARANLSAQEEKIREFKAQHVSDLPGQLQSNLAILAGLQSQRQTDEDNLDRAKQQSVYYQSLLSQYRSLQSSPKSGSGGAPLGLPAIDQELDKLRGQLADLTSRGYTDRHPDIRKVKDQITQTLQMRQQILSDLKASSQADSTTGPPAQVDADSQDTAAMAELKSQLQANKIEIANRERSIAALNAKIGDYQGRLGQEPVREQQLADLSRGYEQSKANYDDLLKKKNASALSTSLTERQEGEHFRVLDPASLPLKPDFPNHLKLCGIGLAVGLFLGVALTGATEFLDDRIHSEKELKALIPVNVLSEIPSVATIEEEQKAQRSAWLAWIAATIVFASILAGTAFSYLRG